MKPRLPFQCKLLQRKIWHLGPLKAGLCSHEGFVTSVSTCPCFPSPMCMSCHAMPHLLREALSRELGTGQPSMLPPASTLVTAQALSSLAQPCLGDCKSPLAHTSTQYKLAAHQHCHKVKRYWLIMTTSDCATVLHLSAIMFVPSNTQLA
jgi:hypothetical protein